MRLIYYYIHLFIQFSDSNTNKPIKLTRNQLSKVLQCSERNVIHILKNMEEKEWIRRESGKGRGNRTVITFLKSLEEMFGFLQSSSAKYHDINGLISYLDQNDLLRNYSHVLESIWKELFGVKKGLPEKEDEEYLHIPYFRPLQSLEPSLIERQTERHMVEQIFDTLVKFNMDRNEVEPSIAHFWERDESGKRWTFYLRKGVTFHNGKVLDAEDVKFTFERLRDSPAKWMVAYLDEVVCIGRSVVHFYFTIPVFNWLYVLCSPKASIVPTDFNGLKPEEFSQKPIGTGPYKVKTHNANLLSLSVHQAYFKERAHIDGISIHIMPSVEKYINIREIEQEPLFYIPFTWNTENDVDYKNIERGNLSIKYLMWNMRKEQVKDNYLLRGKMAEILNKQKMIDTLGYPRFEPVCTFHQQEILEYEPDNQSPAFNLRGPLLLMTYELTPNELDIRWIQNECRKQGIDVELRIVPFSDFFEESRNADLVLSEYVAENVEEIALLNLFQSETSVLHNLLDRENGEKLYDLYETVLHEEFQERRFQVIKQMEELLLTNHIVLPLYSTYQKALYHEQLMGISLSTIGLVPFKDLFYRKEN